MTRFRTALLLALLATFALPLAGCGGGEDDHSGHSHGPGGTHDAPKDTK